MGGKNKENSYSIKPTPGGGYIMTGSTESYGKGKSDILLTKVDGMGQIEWSKAYGGSGDETGWSVAVASDSGYVVAGHTNSYSKNGSNDALIFKTDMNGAVKWTLTLASDSAVDAYNVIAGHSGEFYVTGYTRTDSMGDELFVARISSAGKINWHKSIGTPGNEEGYGLSQDISGDIVFSGITTWDSITVGGKGGGSGDVDMVVGRLSATGGTLKWARTYGTAGKDIAWDVVVDQNRYAFTGWSNGVGAGDNDITLTLVDTNGKVTNGFTYATFGDDRAFSIDLLNTGTYMVGAYADPSGADRSVLTFSVSSNGFLQNYQLIGGGGKDGHWPTDVARTPDGGVVTFSSSNSFSSGGDDDWFLIRSDAKMGNSCNTVFDLLNQSTANYSSDTIKSAIDGVGADYPTLGVTTVTMSDSTLCCKLEVRTIADSVHVCGSEGANLGKSPLSGYKYSWKANNSNWTSNLANPFVKPTESTIYTLVVTSTDKACGSDSATVKVVYNDVLTDDFVKDTFFCEGSSVRVAVRSDLSSYSWIGTHITDNDSVIVATKPDTVYLSLVDKNGCNYADTLKISEKSLPRFSLGNDTSICTNLPITLKGPDGMASYNWNSGSGSKQTYTTNVEQVHSLTVVDSFGCSWSDNISVLTNPFSTFSLGPDTLFCEGTTHYILGPGALKNYVWNDTSSTLQNLPVTGPGTYWLKAFNSFGCPYSDTVTLGTRNAPEFTLTNDTNICDGKTRVLQGPTGMKTYLWQDNSIADTFVANGGGTYSLTVRDSFDCPYTDMVVLTVRANPIVFLGNDTTINWGDSLKLDAGAGYASYEWSTNETTQTIWVKDEDTYSVVVTSEYGCTGGDAINVDTNWVGSVFNMAVATAKIYPVPATDHVVLEISGLPGDDVTLEMIDLSGKTEYREEIRNTGNITHRIDLSEMPAGVHMLRLYNSWGSSSLRILVE